MHRTGPLFGVLTAVALEAGAGWSAPLNAGQGAMAGYIETSSLGGANQVTTISQFSDVRPTDWAFQALSNLIERYGCVAGYPNGLYRGGRPLSRFEAAALLNACLDRVTETTDELKRLLREFEKELAVIKGRVDGLEAKVGALEATQFSTTTKLSGRATFVLGAPNFSGSAVNTAANTVNRRTPNPLTGRSVSAVALPNATTFNYDLQLNFDTSFTGRDLLRTNLRSGNFQGDNGSVFGGNPHSLAISELEVAFEQPSGDNVVGVYKLFYQFPLGNGFTATAGPRVGQEDMIALWPSVYPADTILNVMTVNGAPAAYSKNLGAGAGLWWQNTNWSVSSNYVSYNAQDGDPGAGGIGTRASGATGSVQLAYQQAQWGLAAIYTFLQPETPFVPGTTPFTHSAIDHNVNAATNAIGLSGYWQPWRSGLAPSVSMGWGVNSTNYSTAQPTGSLLTSQSWMVGLQWTDVFSLGNDFGFAVAQ
ncbi:MAG: S-layer homology domain-containing protein, partial [Synechococcaceae bacterium WBB_3_034]|nr:S-layer homology domain-containing protein [Synechococcaceae bacterium WBB_3_034]